MISANPNTDSKYEDIGQLPSRFIPYTAKYLTDKFCFTRILIRPLSVAELKLISSAVVTKDIRNLIRAVDLVIDVPVEFLTVGDFFYILMWLRIKSYTKSPVVVSWTCHAEYYTEKRTVTEPILDIENNEELSTQESQKTRTVERDFLYEPAVDDDIDNLLEVGLIQKNQCSYQNVETLRTSNIEILSLDDVELDSLLDFPRVSVLSELSAFDKNPEYKYLVPAAQWIRYGQNLSDKLTHLEEQSDLSLFDIALNASETIVHGIRETVSLTCAACHTKYVHTLDLNPLTFFRRG